MRHVLTAAVVVIVLPVIALFSGFLYFAQSIETDRAPATRMADGIVVLTGGALRIDDAMTLLAEAKAQRLLISGVNANVERGEIRKLVSGHDGLFDCCVDLGRMARDTIGNAAEAAQWAEQHRFRSLIVVTSAYHMPRAELELGHALKAVTISPHPVILDSLHVERWWAYPSTARLLISEFFKYLAALTRIHVIEPNMPWLLDIIPSGENGDASPGGDDQGG